MKVIKLAIITGYEFILYQYINHKNTQIVKIIYIGRDNAFVFFVFIVFITWGINDNVVHIAAKYQIISVKLGILIIFIKLFYCIYLKRFIKYNICFCVHNI